MEFCINNMEARCYRISVACDIWDLNSSPSHLRWCSPLHLAFLGEVAYACINIQQLASKEEEDTPRIDTWRDARVWVDFFGGLH